jgi:2'-5' RNA ligase
MSTGTYVGLRVLPQSAVKLAEYCKSIHIDINPRSVWERRLHVTLIYSRVHCPELSPDPSKIYSASFDGFDLFTGQTGKTDVLVMKLKSPGVVNRHEQLMREHGATFDHAKFRPHVTLAYDFKTLALSHLPPPDFDLKLGLEYSEDIRNIRAD